LHTIDDLQSDDYNSYTAPGNICSLQLTLNLCVLQVTASLQSCNATQALVNGTSDTQNVECSAILYWPLLASLSASFRQNVNGSVDWSSFNVTAIQSSAEGEPRPTQDSLAAAGQYLQRAVQHLDIPSHSTTSFTTYQAASVENPSFMVSHNTSTTSSSTGDGLVIADSMVYEPHPDSAEELYVPRVVLSTTALQPTLGFVQKEVWDVVELPIKFQEAAFENYTSSVITFHSKLSIREDEAHVGGISVGSGQLPGSSRSDAGDKEDAKLSFEDLYPAGAGRLYQAVMLSKASEAAIGNSQSSAGRRLQAVPNSVYSESIYRLVDQKLLPSSGARVERNRCMRVPCNQGLW
jgi:hypothetical protein